jgi:hypothetical protein
MPLHLCRDMRTAHETRTDFDPALARCLMAEAIRLLGKCIFRRLHETAATVESSHVGGKVKAFCFVPKGSSSDCPRRLGLRF